MKKIFFVLIAIVLIGGAWYALTTQRQAAQNTDLTGDTKNTNTAVQVGDPTALKYYTEEYRPHNYTDANGHVTGLSVELLKLLWKEMGVAEQPIHVLPWARGYRNALEVDGSVLFSTSRTEQREDLFKWVCPISELKQVVFKRTDSDTASINSATELNRYRIGTVRDDVSEQILFGLGVDVQTTESVADIQQNINKLNSGRVDLVAYGEGAFYGALREMNLAEEDYAVAYVMQTFQSCYAFNRSVDDKLIAEFQRALDAVIGTPEHAALLKRFEE